MTAQRGDFERPASPQPGNRDERRACPLCAGVDPVHISPIIQAKHAEHTAAAADQPAPSAGQDTERLRDELVDEIAGSPVGSGYYQSKVDVDEARDIADALLDGPLRQLIAERDQLADALTIVRLARDNTIAERDEARGQVQRVREVADHLGRDAWNICGNEAARAKTDAADRIRRALDPS